MDNPLNENNIITPYARINYEKMSNNIIKMNERIKGTGVKLRPHVKTHKSSHIARIQTNNYKMGIMVSTIQEAQYFANDGCKDIVYGVPISPNKFSHCESLLNLGVSLGVILDSIEIAVALDEYFKNKPFSPDVYLKIDCGYHRAGMDPLSEDTIDVSHFLHKSSTLNFKGVLSHSGHSYNANNVDEIITIGESESSLMFEFSSRLKLNGISCDITSIGSTPTLSCGSSIEGVNEIRPGNYIFFDLVQQRLGSCSMDDIALEIVTTVIGHYPEQGKLLVDAGSLALSKDQGDEKLFNQSGYGLIFDYSTEELLKNLSLKSLSQEHGQIYGVTKCQFDRYPIGAKLVIKPNHSCLTAAAYGKYYIMKNGIISDTWPRCNGW